MYKMNKLIQKQPDLLDREIVFKNLTISVLDIQDKPFVLAINALWGEGKTFFVNKWIDYLKGDKKYECIYFNAWSSDYAEYPLFSFIAEILDKLGLQDDKEMERKTKALFKSIGKSVLVNSVSVLSKASIGLDLSDLANVDKMEDELASLVNSKVKSYSDDKRAIEDFKGCIGEKIKKKKLVIFVDELDRCRPTYAIELLETIKHIFDIPNIIFVVSIDKSQLSKAITSCYGVDGNEYLKRFFNLTYTLPVANTDAFIDKLLEDNGILKILDSKELEERDYLKSCLHYIDEQKGMSLRSMESFIKKLSVVLSIVSFEVQDAKYLFSELIAVSIFLEENGETYLLNSDINASHVRKFTSGEKMLSTNRVSNNFIDSDYLTLLSHILDSENSSDIINISNKIGRKLKESRNQNNTLGIKKYSHLDNVLQSSHNKLDNIKSSLNKAIRFLSNIEK